ncbi:7-carboxy-7-deazaguanine synthase QueE [Helicobacter sp. faydin-H20]|uniref:7-carboxy-7-deazaguanine synthase QueE n=1 Tax=Helicobacter anatolicus TaxID=2905874 RepID=UPI001E44E63D|nr:7-carboxy-7-deazaguanine synthase QueE [Helicobacter anatolicus]MCE3036908.1 7-carboxy-7-deazaguanine synthase QueE [Helicobacter anatolicus]
MLKIVEIFYSIQGEGKYIGSPSVFVRVGLCNLKCRGFGQETSYKGKRFVGCDSIYAANAAFKKEWTSFNNAKDLIEAIKKVAKTQYFDIVLTGGEPSLYFDNPVLLETLEYFLARSHRICVESNGSIYFTFNEILKQIEFTLSVKLSNSLEEKNKRVNIPAIQNILDHAKDVVFKFVIDEALCQEEKGINEINEILSQISGSYEVYLMPMGSEIIVLDRNIQAILPLCLKYNFKLTDRLHIRIWGDKRGV